MDDLSVNKYLEAFEEFMVRKAEEWGFDPEIQLEYYAMDEEEQAEHPLRGDFFAYRKLDTAQMFAIFVAGAKTVEDIEKAQEKEALEQALESLMRVN